jgi:hypothetical protein
MNKSNDFGRRTVRHDRFDIKSKLYWFNNFQTNGKWQVEYVVVDQRFIQGDANYDFSLMKIKPNLSNQYI